MAEPTSVPTPVPQSSDAPPTQSATSFQTTFPSGISTTPTVDQASTPTPTSAVNPLPHSDAQQKLDMVAGLNPAQIANIHKRVTDLAAAGQTRDNSTEAQKLMAILDLYARARQNRSEAQKGGNDQQQPPQTATNGASNAPGSAAPPAGHVAMTPQQIAQLRSQAASYQLLSRNQPVPQFLQQAAQGTPPPGSGGSPAAPNPLGEGIENKIMEKTIEAAVGDAITASQTKTTKADAMEVDGAASGASSDNEKVTTPPAGPLYAAEYDEASIIYPYNAYAHPSVYANRKFDEEIANPLTKMQRLLVPSVMPKGLDPYLLMEERNRFIDTRIAWRMKELEEMDSTAGMEQGAQDVPGVTDGEKKPRPSLGIQARIELLSLRLRDKQRLLREDMVRAMNGATQVPADRSQFRRFRTHTLRDARATETAERRQRTEREQRGKQRHIAYINSICEHGQNVIGAGVGSSRGAGAEKMRRMGRLMMKLHSDTEKEEQRRVERLAKERLKALKNDDEDAYLALLGEAKDSRIGHLLKQTDQYLETLAAAVVEQQNDDVHKDEMAMELPYEEEDGPADETMFGARRQDGEEEGAERKAGKVDYYAIAHRKQEKVTKQADMLTGGTLKDYQVKGLQWMISLYNNRLNGILADEMGLGKTIQTISLITYLIEKKQQRGPFLVLVPLSTLTNWTLEFQRWAPTVSTVILKGSPNQRKEQYGRLRALDFQVCLTTYEYVIKERPILAKIKWIHMIIDEGHRMKNVKSKLSQTLNDYYTTRYRLILTGTPLQNNLPELWALLNFVLPKIFNSVKSFDEWFNAPFANTGGEKMEMNEEEALLVVKRLHKVLRPFLLRRLKRDVESELPDKVEKVIYTKMSALQWRLYESVKTHKTLPTDVNAAKPRRQVSLQNALMQLRKICNHPFVFPEVDDDFSDGNNIDERIVRSAGKFELLDRILPKLFDTGHKVLIFFQMTEIMTIIADFFDYRGWKYCRLDGGTKADDRQTLLSTFNDPNSPYQVFILSTRAGGLGLNLQSADTVIIFDTDWNPHADLQAQDRAHRIGQKKEVRVLRLISSGTVEELVLSRAQRKLEIDGKVIQAGKFDDVTTGAEYEALLAKAFEQNEDDNEETNELDDDELNELLARGDQELGIFTQMDKDRKQAQLERWKAEGHKGELPPPLMADSELPAFYRRDLAKELAAQPEINDDEIGRGRRTKAEVKYTDGLTDDQWLNALDDSDDDPDDAAVRKKQRAEKKAERKRMNQELEQAEARGEPLSSVPIKLLQDPDVKPAKKRGRPSKSATPSVLGDDVPTKRRKVEESPAGPSPVEMQVMSTLYNETNALKTEVGEMLNQYFVKPVDKKMFFDYYTIIKQPMTMGQIKKSLGKPNYTLTQFRDEMHLVWDNARTYNEEASWVYNAADDMQEFFDRRWEEEMAKLNSSSSASLGGNGDSGPATALPSGTSTPMYRPQDKVQIPGPRIKISVGGSKRKQEIKDESEESEDEDEDEEEDDEDDDY
ncbi:SNF2 family N-terminal domain-domain-containing protein [Naematelia encephala]|uniref:SNF2 family N-terminal domain-domain-containing protein n=1 Tax=Naematelia encephala TaxID=71784 RepID=A0A1Y2ARS1_9TREE|nr:SNF2 family N-terminal domain-domain-containing protein [Naematelia encephala]